MKRLFSALFALLFFACAALSARDQRNQEKSFFITLQGGPGISLNENIGTFFDNNSALKLVKFHGAASIGGFFSRHHGIRIYGEYSMNSSGSNVQETSAGGFWPYTFKSGTFFADYIVNGGDISSGSPFRWRPYVGIGAAYTFGFTDNHHPWQKYSTRNIAMGFRYGVMLEYLLTDSFGLFLDGAHLWFTDTYNGMSPKNSKGEHLGFPFDMKLNISLGAAIHF